MLLVSFVLLYMAIVKKFEPLLLLPISFGMMLANLPLAGLMYDAQDAAQVGLAAAVESGSQGEIQAALAELASAHWYDSGVLRIIYMGVKSSIFPCLIFMAVGAMTDFGPLLANPISLLLGAAAQFGIYVAFMIAIGIGIFSPEQAASIAIIGGADGPTAIFLTSKLNPTLLGAVAVSAYSYMALIPLIQPPLMRLFTTQKERLIKMKPARVVSQNEKIIFPIVGLMLTCFVVPSGLPLLGMLFFGNLLRESGVTTRLAKTASNAMTDIVTILLGLTVGASTQASRFLTTDTIIIFALGFVAFIIASSSGVLSVKLFNIFLRKDKKINPLIGNAGVSAVPMAARISNNVGLEYDPSNYLLMHAMGPNVAGVIGSAVAAGVLLSFLG